MKKLTSFMLLASFAGIVAVSSCKKTTKEVYNVQTEPEDMLAVAGMENAYTHMVQYHDSFSHTHDPHHKKKHDSIYHHHDSVYVHHHTQYHHKDTSHHNKTHHTLKHQYRHDSLNVEHHKFPH